MNFSRLELICAAQFIVLFPHSKTVLDLKLIWNLTEVRFACLRCVCVGFRQVLRVGLFGDLF